MPEALYLTTRLRPNSESPDPDSYPLKGLSGPGDEGESCPTVTPNRGLGCERREGSSESGSPDCPYVVCGWCRGGEEDPVQEITCVCSVVCV